MPGMTTLTFDQRLSIGLAHERDVAAELVLRGWTVDPWGQGVLSPATRRAVQNTESTLRWTPDFVASRDGTVVLIDAKGSTSPGSGRHCVSRSALKAGTQYTAWMDLPLYYVFSDYGVMTPHELAEVGRDGPHLRVGESGAYILFGAGLCRPFDVVFGQPILMQVPRWDLEAAPS